MSVPPSRVHRRDVYDPVLTWKGAWAAVTNYLPGDCVSIGGAVYICIVSHANQSPPSVTYWVVTGGSTKIVDTTLGGVSATIDFTGVLTMFSHLLIHVFGRSNAAVAAENIWMRFNNDSGTNYGWQYLYGSNAAITVADQGAAALSYIFVGNIPGSTAPANVFGQSSISIINYTDATNQKTATAVSVDRTAAFGAGSSQLHVVGGLWTGTAAINRITFLPQTGSFIAGSRVTIYGMV